MKRHNKGSKEKFGLLVDFGPMVVHDAYNSYIFLDSLKEKHEGKFLYYDNAITDKKFPKPSRIIKPGDRFNVRAFEQIGAGTTTSTERIEFLKSLPGQVWLGTHGIGLVFQEMRDQLPKDRWYASFDKKSRFWKDTGGRRKIPRMSALSGGDFGFGLDVFERVWYRYDVLLSFCDEQSLDQ